MLAKELISDITPSLRITDTGQSALNLMEVFRISHLPIVENNEFLGVISDQDIFDLNMAGEQLEKHQLSLFSPFVYDYQHVYEVINIVHKLKLTVIPVLDESKKYLGMITLGDLLQYFATFLAVQNPGGIIELELNNIDYSLTQIAQIVEGNDTKILSLYVSSNPDSNKINLTLKLNRQDISGVLQAFERYDFDVRASYMDENKMEDLYQERYDEFMRYLNT